MRKMLRTAVLGSILVAPFGAAAQTPRFIVFFAEWSAALDEAAQSVIHRAILVAKDPTAHLTVTGYADNKGTQAANQLLSDLRAEVVVDALRAGGVPATQIGTGPSGPLPASGVIGRRVEITVARP